MVLSGTRLGGLLPTERSGVDLWDPRFLEKNGGLFIQIEVQETLQRRWPWKQMSSEGLSPTPDSSQVKQEVRFLNLPLFHCSQGPYGH